ncbi:coiled-coil domain-containing protein [Paenibacillus sp. sgz5001063]|uniref:coiled-coil domain-containing protein n=1 Tax=Paenibacillus sp. sgz5001063 TaxID=3242474 RepID=UPI0036D2EB07
MKSRNNRSRFTCVLLILLCFTVLPLMPPHFLSADPGTGLSGVSPPVMPDNEVTRKLLEQTLSSAEIEQEISRITAEQKALEEKASLLEKRAVSQQSAIQNQREQAGAIIRSYYMGDRDGLLAAVLSAKSIGRLLALYDYYEIIIGRDRDILSQYEAEYKKLKATLTAAQSSSEELATLKTALEQQKERIAALHEDIDKGIQSSSDPASMSALLEEFTKYWENIGVHEVKTYFKALSSAMKQLPEFVQSRDGIMTRKGMTYNLALKEADLNEFLISQNELFKDFAFQFNDNEVIASGKSGGLSLTLTGHYTIQEEPVNGLMFHVDHVVFNGLELPDTTRKALEEEFDLGFYPAKIVSFLRATEVSSQDGVLHVKLSLSF